jgi:hypothetical protein
MDPDTGDKSEDIAKVSHLLLLLEWHMTKNCSSMKHILALTQGSQSF